MRKKSLLLYGGLAVAAYYVYKHMQATAAPAIAVAPAAAPPTMAGVGRLGYFPSGVDRPFAPAALKAPFARYNAGARWY